MSELIDRQALKNKICDCCEGKDEWCNGPCFEIMIIDSMPAITASPWHRVEDGLPKEAGEYIVAYHPCRWDDVKTSVTEIGIDTFRGKTSWAKRKFQRVTHWMEKPEPPKEDGERREGGSHDEKGT